MDLLKYLKLGLKWWWLAVLCVVLAAVSSYLYSERQPRIYASRTTIMVGSNILQNPDPNTDALTSIRTLAEIYGQAAKRKQVTQAVIDRLGLDMSSDQLSTMIQTTIIPASQLLEITIFDVHPQRAQILADAVAQELLLQSPGESKEQQNTRRFIYTQLQELQTQIEETGIKIKETEDSLLDMTSAADIAEAQSRLVELQKLKSDYQDKYSGLTGSVSQWSLNTLTVVEPAVEPTTPISPDVRKNVLIAAVAGLVLAISAIVILEFVNDTMVWQSQEEATALLSAPILGPVSRASGPKKIIEMDKLWSPEANSLRAVRDNMMLSMGSKPLNTLLVTSSESGEGKSYLSTNLAVTMASPGTNLAAVIASPGSKVILVDADLRKPSLHELFDMPNLLGLADVLAMPEVVALGMLKKALRPTHISNLMLLPAGRNPLDPGSLVSSPNFAKVLEYLKTQADLIVIDSGPMLEVVETKVIANQVDGVVLVVSNGRSRRRHVQRSIQYLKHNPQINFLGLVFNRVNLRRGYGYGYDVSAQKFGQLDKSRKPATFWQKILPFKRAQSTESATLSLVEAADYLGVSKDTAFRWCKEGRIQAVKNGQNWSVRLEDLNEFAYSYQYNGTGRDPISREV